MVNILILLVTFLSLIFSQSISAQLPNDPLIVHGHAHIDVTGNHMTIANTPNTILNWQNFSIGPQDSVYFQQQDTASQILNRVTGNDPSHILGNLSSNGHVWLVNPYGVLFGPNARIDVAGLVASTLDISNIDFLASRNQFYSANNLGEVRNQGDIQTTLGGKVWLVGNQVKNEGVIQTPSGQIALAAGNSIELVDSGAPNVVVRIKAPENQTVNLGSLIASNGGNIDLHGSIVNQEGIVRANSLSADAAGYVVLKADQVSLSANSETQADKGFIQMEVGTTLNNWGLVNSNHVSFAANEILQQGKIIAHGGSINLVANAYTYLDGLVDVSDLLGTGGTIKLFTGKLEGMAGAALRSDGGQGGFILVQGRETVAFSSTLSAIGNTQGGQIEVTGDRVILLNSDINASGGEQGGSVHLGGEWQGGGDLSHAREVLVGVGSEVKAGGSASAGTKGGEIVVWSTQSSEHYGSLQAKNGGHIEFSSKGEIRQTGDIQVGTGGTVLFDPKNLIITDSPPDNLTLARKVSSGSVFNGEPNLVNQDLFGISVSLDGDRMAVGSVNDDTGGINRGAVHLFTGVSTSNFAGLTWQKKLASSQGAIGMTGLGNSGEFGESVALDGDNLAVGAVFDNTSGGSSGAVYLFNGLSANSTNSIAISGATFDNKAAETSYITTQTLESQLAQGSNVVLQANNDIVIDSPINVSNTEGSGGDLTLQAGRNITFIEGISTDSGDLTVVAGDPGANPSDKDPGTPTLRINSNVNLNVGDGRVTLAAVNGNFINNNGDSAITGRWHIYADAFNTSIEGFSIASFNRHFNQAYVPGSVPDYATSGNWFLYRQAPLLFVGAGVETITYNDTIPVFKPVITGFLPGDGLGNATISGVPVWSVAGDYSTSSKPVKGAHDVIYTNGLVSEQGYQFADNTSSIGELTVNAKTLVASNFTATSKIYDGNLSTDVDGSSFILGKVENDIVTLTGKGSFDDKNAGDNKRVTTNFPDVLLDGDDKGNYVLANFDSIITTANISPKVLTAGNFVAINKIYDDKFDATLVNGSGSSNEVISSDNITLVGGIGTFNDKNVGTNIPVTITGVSLEGADRKNYVLGDIQSTTANISPATLTHKANPTTRFIGTELSGFTGTFDGFKGDDNLQNDVSGQLVWKTSAINTSLPGSYPINAEGITARNYILVPAESNKTALTLSAFNSTIRQGTTDTSIQGTNTALLGTKAILDSASEGKVADVTAYTSASMGSGFGRLNLANMSHEDMLRLIDFRRDFKEKLFSDAIDELEIDPSLSDIPVCTNLSELNLGACRISDAQREELKLIALRKKDSKRIGKYKARVASLPEIERKFVVVIGIDQYADKAIPSLDNAISDASAVSQLFADKLGYEVQVIKNATRAEIIKTINQLAAEVEINDSVVVYYAGHGYLNRKTGTGYWIPADASSKDPSTWISNNSISEMLAEIRSKQMVMISDSCYSGSLTKEQGVGVSGGVIPADILTKRSVVVMASGGDEPVADEGKNGHSIFAWYLMEALNNVDSWKIGTNIFERIQTDVMKSFPQTPQYGAAISAGHQIGGDYLFEFRQLEITQ